MGLLLAIGLCEALGWPFLRAPLQQQLQQRLGTEVLIEAPFKLHLLGTPRLAAGHLRIGAAPGSDAPFLVDARDAALALRWADLLALRRGEPLHLRRLQADSLQAHLLRPRDGRASWAFAEPAADGEPARLPRVDRLWLRDGTIRIDDALLALQLDARMRIAAGTADATSPSTQPAASAASAPPPGASDGNAVADANPDNAPARGLALSATGSYRKLPVKARVQAPQIEPLLDGDAGDKAVDVPVLVDVSIGRATLGFDGRLGDPLGEPTLDGTLKLSGPSLSAVGEPLGLTLPATPPFALEGRLARHDPVWHLDVATATVGRSRLAGEFAYDPQPAVPKLSGSLRGQRLVLGDLAPALGGQTGAGGDDKPRQAKGAPRIIPNREFDLPSLRAMDADVAVALDELDLGSSAVEPLRPLKGRIGLAGGVLTLEQLDARTAGGRIAGSTVLDANAKPAKWQADLQWSGIDLAGWLRGARKDGASVSARSAPAKLQRERQAARSGAKPAQAYVTGELRGDLKLSGRGNSTAAILSSLNGDARARLRDGTISHLLVELMGIDIAQGLGVWIKGDEALPLHCAVVDAKLKDGIVIPRVALIDTRDSTVSIDGSVDLGYEKLDLRAKVRPKDFTIAALRAPLHIEGPFAAPKARVEGGPIAARAIASVALGVLVGPLAAVLPLIDPGDGESDGCRRLAAAGTPAKSAR